jgi:purine-binding chemotaxis protein CheW
VTAAALEPGPLLTFALSGDEYAVPLLRVQEIVEYEPVTRVPAAPSFLLGVFDLRGSVLPVIDLATKLGFGASSVTRRSCIVVVELEIAEQPALLGLLVDSVREVLTSWDADSAPSAEHDGDAVHRPWRELERAGTPALRLLDLELVMAARDASRPGEPPDQVYNAVQIGAVEPRDGDPAPEGR